MKELRCAICGQRITHNEVGFILKDGEVACIYCLDEALLEIQDEEIPPEEVNQMIREFLKSLQLPKLPEEAFRMVRI